jgi:hypothetical protein
MATLLTNLLKELYATFSEYIEVLQYPIAFLSRTAICSAEGCILTRSTQLLAGLQSPRNLQWN